MISNFLEVLDLSKYNDVCLDAIRESEVGNYSFIKGDSSYDTNKQFLFTSKLIPLAKEIQLNINNYTEEFKLEKSIMSSSWFNILYKGGIVEKHQHAESWETKNDSMISGAYYPYVDENSCSLIFENEDENYESIPTSGMMVMFPSWLSHYTKPNQSNKRITVSFNTIRKEVYLERSK